MPTRIIRQLRRGCALAGLLLLFSEASPAVAASQSGSTTVTVSMPEYLVLHYYSAIGINFTAASAASSSTGSFELSWTDLGASASTELAASASATGPASTTVTLENAWALAGLSSSGTASVEISGDSSFDKAGSASSIAVSDYRVATDAGVGGSVEGQQVTTRLRGVGSEAGTVGDVKMNLDFSNTTQAGSHTGTFTIVAQTI